MFLQLCPVCEHRNPRGSRFCNECGSPLQLRFCPACHAAEDVTSLVCRACGEQLPPLPLETPLPAATDVLPDTESIWKADAPPPGLHLAPDDGITVTVHGGGNAGPLHEDERDRTRDPELPLLSERIAEPEAEPESASDRAVPKTRGPTVIERLHGAQAELDPPPLLRTDTPPVAPEAIRAGAQLTAESESEIEISAEAETLVEASVAPVTYQRPDEIAVNETAPVDQVADPLREGAWRSALPADAAEAARLAPALLQAPPRPQRQLSMHRIGLVLAAVGAIAALVYSVRISPGTGSSPAPTAASAPAPATVPAPDAGDALPPAAAVTAVMPDPSTARGAETAPAPAPTAAPRPDSQESAPGMPPASIARTEAPAPVATRPAPPPKPTTSAATRDTYVPPVSRARGITVETPRTCTPAVAALGLCTLETNQEGK